MLGFDVGTRDGLALDGFAVDGAKEGVILGFLVGDVDGR